MPARFTREDFIKNAVAVHGKKYNYSKVDYRNSSSKVEIICKTHGPFMQSYEDHVRKKAGCPGCKGGVNGTLESFLVKATQVHGDMYDYSKFVYINSATPGVITCKKHGDFQQRPNNHTHKTHPAGCPKCGNKTIAKLKTKTLDTFIEKARQIHEDRYDYSKSQYTGCDSPILIRCNKHGDFYQTPNNHYAGRGCPACGLGISNTGEFIQAAIAVHGERYGYGSAVYVDSQTRVLIECRLHGKFLQLPSNHLSGAGCKKCAVYSLRDTTESFIEKARVVHGDTYDYTQVQYSSSQKKITIVCKKHGEFRQVPNSHLNGSGCPSCGKGANRSSYELWLEKNLGPDFTYHTANRLFGDTSRESVDAYSEKHKLAVEINGVYWHSEDKGKDRHYHISKTVRLKRQSIQLLHFWDYEIDKNPELVLSMIRQKMGISRRLYARKLVVDESVPADEARDFLNANHLQGYVHAKWSLGLRSKKNGKLACLMTFGASRFSKGTTASVELIRYASVRGLTVVGGASRLLTHFMRNHPGEEILSYADIRHSYGNLYKQLGFKFSHRSDPNYFWYNESTSDRLPRYRTQKHKLPDLLGSKFDSSLSEKQNMQNAGYYRVFDCGNLVYHKTPIE